MKTILLIFFVVLLGVNESWAKPVLLTFEGLSNLQPVADYYNGAGGSSLNYGVSFGPTCFALYSNSDGGAGQFSGNPSGSGILYLDAGNSSSVSCVMNVAGGFTQNLSFYYSAPYVGGTVSVYSGPNGTGDLLSVVNLSVTPHGQGQPNCNPYQAYCPWIPIAVPFSGTAKSVVFGGTTNRIGFDDVSLGL